MKVIITAPSLDPSQNVSGVSSVVQFIIEKNTRCEYLHFQLGKSDKETGLWNRVTRVFRSFWEWKNTLSNSPLKGKGIIIHYSFPLSAPSILRDPIFMYYAIRKHCKMVVHVHGGLFLTAPKIPFILKRILKWVFSWDVPFVVLSEGEKKTLQERFGAKRVYVLPNCPSLPGDHQRISRIDTKDCNKDESIYQQISQIDTDESTLVMGYLGRIEPNKGMTELLEACKRLKDNGVSFKLRIAGKEQVKGEYLPLYRQSLGDNFEYVGLVSGETKDAFLRSLDIFVMPTYFEGLPMSLLESMGYGVVPVVPPVGSIPDVVCPTHSHSPGGEENCNGVFVNVKDVDSIVEAVTMLNNNRETMKHLSRNALKTILENFSAEQYVEKLNEIYDAL